MNENTGNYMVGALCSLQCCHDDGWVAERTSDHWKLFQPIQRGSLLEQIEDEYTSKNRLMQVYVENYM